MPTYEYLCSKCGHHFDKYQPITDKSLTVCPKELCGRKRWGKGKIKKVIGAGAGLIFKGTGFYITDYRSEKYKEAAKKDSSAASSSASSGSGDSKSTAAAPAAASTPAKTDSKPSKPSKAAT